MRFSIGFRISIVRVLVVCFLGMELSSPALAQRRSSVSDEEIASIKEEFRSLKETQVQILQRLDELKSILKPEPPPLKTPESINIQGDTFQGDANARVAILEFADFECPFCGRFKHDTYPQILENYVKTGKVKYLYRDFPLAFHANAMPAALAAHCAAEQGKFWEMHDSLFAHQTELSAKEILSQANSRGFDTAKMQECLASGRHTDEIKKSVADGEKMEVSGTPSFVIGLISPTGDLLVKKTIVGAYPYETFKAAIDDLLEGRAEKGN